VDIKPLLDVGCKTVANMIKGKSPEEVRKTFNITNDFTPEEEDQIRRETSGSVVAEQMVKGMLIVGTRATHLPGLNRGVGSVASFDLQTLASIILVSFNVISLSKYALEPNPSY
jgi:hypothetical protein